MKIPLVAEIKRNSLDDGPGIRSTVFFKGCPLSCAWCHNPECTRPGPELMLHPDRCLQCGECEKACQHDAADGGGKVPLNRARCQLAGDCVRACPSGARELVGRRYEVAELVSILCRDLGFFQNSGGGVTLSGGEPTLYLEYCAALCDELRARGVSILLETCGHFDWDVFERGLLSRIDLVYVDLKFVDSARHEEFCGRGNEKILRNIEKLVAHFGDRCRVRIPLVPGVTAEPAALQASAKWLRARGIRRVELLPYNPLWRSKALGLGREIRPEQRDREWMSAAEIAAARECFHGFELI